MIREQLKKATLIWIITNMIGTGVVTVLGLTGLTYWEVLALALVFSLPALVLSIPAIRWQMRLTGVQKKMSATFVSLAIVNIAVLIPFFFITRNYPASIGQLASLIAPYCVVSAIVFPVFTLLIGTQTENTSQTNL